jgi:hypothetical protein
LTSARNSSLRIEISGFLIPAAEKISMTLSDETAFEIICFIAESSSSSDCRRRSQLESLALTAWKNAISSLIFIASSLGTASAKASIIATHKLRTCLSRRLV